MADSEWIPIAAAQAWQVTLLIVLVAAINRWAGRSRPHLAHALWLVVLVKCVTPPIWSSPSGLFCWLQPSREVIRKPLAAELRSRNWSELLAESRELESAALVDRDDTLEEPDVGVVESLLSIGEFNNAVAEVPSRIAADKVTWPSVMFAAWMLASLVVIGVAVVRWLRCWRILRNAPQRECPELSEQMDSLAKQLRLRRRVRLIVTESRLGPAVIGLFRTTVLLPALIVDRFNRNANGVRADGCPSSQAPTPLALGLNGAGDVDSPLAPILAHELLHIRRGDLWVGLLQTLAQAVWWCHPLVWWVNRRTTREAERCCDEEVLAELGCDPAAYARALVDVLELKRELKPVPVFPGVRPVEVTSQRLERIMQLGQGCQRRTPWWCWLLAGLAAVATWPGAAFVVTAEDPGERGGVSPPVISAQPTNRGADASPLADAWSRAIVRRIEPRQGLSYQVRVISGSEDDVRALARSCDEKMLAASSTPVVVANDELQRLLKAAQAAPRINLVSHPKATSRGGESAIVADTKNFAVPVEVTQQDETVQFFDTVREHGWKLTLQPVTLGESSLRLRVVNWQGRLNHDDAVKVRYRTTGEEKLIPGLNERQTSTTVELRDDQQLVFPVAPVPESSSQTFMLLTLQVRRADLGDTVRLPEPVASALPATPIVRGVGANSNAGITGDLVSAEAPTPPGQVVYQKIDEAPAVGLPAPPQFAPPAPLSDRQVLLRFKIFEVDAEALPELGIKLGRAKTSWDGVKTRKVVQFQVDRDVITKLAAMEREQRIKVLSSPSITTLDGHVASFLSGGEFAVPAIVGVGEAKGTATTFRGFGLQLTAKPTIVGPDSLRVSLTMSDSKVADDPNGGATTVAPTLISQSIQSELLLKSKQSVFFGPLGEPGAKGKQLIATLDAEIVESNPTTPVSGEVLPSPAAPRLTEHGDRATKYSVDRPAGGHITLLKSQPVSAVAGEEKLVSCHFENVPLKAAMKQLAQSTGRNIVLEKPGLEEEGLTERVPITLSLDDVKLSSAFKLMLDPLNLGYRVEESGVIVVTSQQRLRGQAIVATYAVADLAVPVPKRAAMKLTADLRVANEESKPHDSAKPMTSQIPELIKLITSTCQPNSWEEVGGVGRIKANDSTLSLVVWQTQDVHDEIRGLLEQLRRLQNIQASLHVETLTVPADFWHKVGKDFDDPEAKGQPIPQLQDKSAPRSVARLTKKEAALLRSLSRPESAPKVTLFNRQELEIFFGGESPTLRLGLKPVVTDDRKSLLLQAAAVKPEAELDFTKLAAITLKSGDSLLLDVTTVLPADSTAATPILNKVPHISRLFTITDKPDRRTLLLVTGTVVIVEEEEVQKTSRGHP